MKDNSNPNAGLDRLNATKKELDELTPVTKVERVTPLRDRVLILPVPADEMTASGLHIPNQAQVKPLQGIVVSVGSGRVLDDGTKVPVEVNVGQRVMFGRHAGSVIPLNGKDHLLMREDDLLGKFTEPTKGE